MTEYIHQKRAAIILGCLNLVDCITTYIGIHYAGLHEDNPAMALMFRAGMFVPLKLFLGTGVAILAWRKPSPIVAYLAGIYMYVAFSNIRLIIRELS